MKKNIFAAILLFLALVCQAQSIDGIYKKIDSLKTATGLSHGQWSLYAEYSDNGEPLIEYNASLSLAPASGLKVFTTSASLYYLGEDFKYKTVLYSDGKTDRKGTLKGDIIIGGSGDPTLGSDFVKGSLQMASLLNEWTEAVRKAGINKITGRIIADESLFRGLAVPGAWYWEDIGNYYGAPVSAVCFNDNTYKVYFRPGAKTGDPAPIIRTEPEIPGLRFENHMLTGPEGSGDNGVIYCAPGSDFAEIRGTVPAGVAEFSIKGSIPSPALFAAAMLRGSLIANGIGVKGKAAAAGGSAHQVYYPESSVSGDKFLNHDFTARYVDPKGQNLKEITSVFSPALKDIVYMTNKRSNNLYTEQLFRTIAAKLKGEGSEEKGFETMNDFLTIAGVPQDGVSLYDGCGLSRSDMITAKAMSKLLSFNYHQSYFNSFYRSLEIAGDPDDIGYHQKMGANTIIAGNVRLKSGLINRVRSHSGYLKTRSGRMISFSFIANNFPGSYRDVDEMHKEIMILLAELK